MLHEEVFGPHVAIIPVKNIEEAVKVYNDTDYGLACAVITEDFRKAKAIRDDCEYGLGYVNLPTIGAEVHLPFGGVKKSGTGTAIGQHADRRDNPSHRVDSKPRPRNQDGTGINH